MYALFFLLTLLFGFNISADSSEIKTASSSVASDVQQIAGSENSFGDKVLKFFYDDEFKQDPNFQRHRLEFETGGADIMYNKIGKDSNTGSLVNVANLQNNVNFYFRISYYFNLDRKNSFKILIAPFKYGGSGYMDRGFSVNGANFGAGMTAFNYQFNSYRFTYRRSLFSNQYVDFKLGLTLKIRDASFSIVQGGSVFSQSDVGFVPLGHINLEINPIEKLYLVFEGDFAAVPQGRALDFAFSCRYNVSKNIDFSVGYRFLEGGAFNANAFQKILVNYYFASVGFRI